MKPKAYYAHPMALYATSIEALDLSDLRRLFKVINPANPLYRHYSMEQFVELACSCDVVAFRAFDDGKIGSGMALEIEAAVKANIPVFELSYPLFGRVLTRNQTRDRMGLPPLRHPDTAPIRTLSNDVGQDWCGA